MVLESFNGKTPAIGKNTFVHNSAVIIGDVIIGDDCGIWPNAVLRGDSGPIRVGNGTNIQDCAVLHNVGGTKVIIGEGVTVGHGAIVHGSSVGNNSLIGFGASLMNNSVIGNDCIVGAGALVTQSTVIEDKSLVVGSPAKVKREVTEAEMESTRKNAEEYKLGARAYLQQK